MKIIISTDNGQVSAHFGRCPEFTLVDIVDCEVKERSLIKNPGHSPNFLPKYFNELGAEAIVAGGMGMRAQALFEEMGITAIAGITGPIEETIDKLAAGTLKGGESLCRPGGGKGYGVDKEERDHDEDDHEHHHHHHHHL
ncbi:MAG: NifB/NifX family molybdenum-iron cluster-binding protein [Candidatus Auribacterota bacterium]|nr:NifB/NifX family molybdenum-iron cluster-binding protein [Candidatus Auribacterota bacterium]